MTDPTAEQERPGHERRVWRLLPVLVALVVLAGFGHGLLKRYRQPYVHTFMIFGTYGRLTFWGPEKEAAAAAKEIVDELKTLQSAINTYDSTSEICQLNREAHTQPFSCSDRLWAILHAGRTAYEVSDGSFDISIGPLMKLWGFYGKRKALPTDEDIARAADLTGLDQIVFDADKKTVHFPKEGMFLDFGGLAKGYALDMCREIAEKHAISQGMMDLGGNIACLAKPPPGKDTYTIGIRNPAATNQVLETVSMTNLCIATSGNYERYFVLDDVFVHHIIDPATGRPVPARASVTVIAPQGLATDIFSTAIFVQGASLAERFIQQEPRGRVEIISAADPEGAADPPMRIQRFNWPDLSTEERPANPPEKE